EAFNLATMLVRVSCISMGFCIGSSTCFRNVAARPSQKNDDFQARFSRGMAFRAPALPSAPILTFLFSENAISGRWQVAQDCELLMDNCGSKNNRRPSSTPSLVNGLSLGSAGRGKKLEMVNG